MTLGSKTVDFKKTDIQLDSSPFGEFANGQIQTDQAGQLLFGSTYGHNHNLQHCVKHLVMIVWANWTVKDPPQKKRKKKKDSAHEGKKR